MITNKIEKADPVDVANQLKGLQNVIRDDFNEYPEALIVYSVHNQATGDGIEIERCGNDVTLTPIRGCDFEIRGDDVSVASAWYSPRYNAGKWMLTVELTHKNEYVGECTIGFRVSELPYVRVDRILRREDARLYQW